jgi:hypothetical protein
MSRTWVGGPGDDLLVGDDGPNSLIGGAGGVDRLRGWRGRRTRYGSAPRTARPRSTGARGRDAVELATPATVVRLRDDEVDRMTCISGPPRDVELDPSTS